MSDEAGNKSTIDIVAQIDVKPPTCTNSGGSTSWTNSSSTTIKGTCADTGGSLCVKNVSKTYNTDGTWSNQTPGTVQDNAGNSTACASDRTIKRDTVDPVISWNTGSGPYNDSNGITVSTSCSDDRSGVASHTGSTSVGSPTSSSGKSVTHTCKDNAGNSDSTSRTFKVRKYSAHSSCGLATCSDGDCCGWKTCVATACGCKSPRYGCGKSQCGTTTNKSTSSDSCSYYSLSGCSNCACSGFTSKNCDGKYTPGLTSGATCTCSCVDIFKATQANCCEHEDFGCKTYKTCSKGSCCGYESCWHY